MNANYLLIALTFLLVTGCTERPKETPYLLNVTDKPSGIGVLQEKDHAFVSGIYATGNTAISLDTATIFVIPLSKSVDIMARLINRQSSDSSVFWQGDVPGDSLSSIFLTSTHNVLSGRIITKDGLFRIAYVDSNYYQIATLHPGKLMDTLDDADVPIMTDTTASDMALACRDATNAIDVLVVYTPAAEAGAGGARGMKSLIDQSINLSNVSYDLSGVSQRIRLAHAEKITYTESGNSVTDRNALQNTSDGVLDQVHALRALHSADIVVLIVETLQPGACGQAYIQETVSTAFAAYAFAVVKRQCSADNLTFAHELGHIMGARHHDDPGTLPYPWAHGHEKNGYQSVMSKVSGSIRTTNFSNPSVNWANTQPTGVTATRENFRVLNATASTVTKFVCKNP